MTSKALFNCLLIAAFGTMAVILVGGLACDVLPSESGGSGGSSGSGGSTSSPRPTARPTSTPDGTAGPSASPTPTASPTGSPTPTPTSTPAPGDPCDTDAECDDGLFCNGQEQCTGGFCQPSFEVPCPNFQEVCDEESNTCEPDTGGCQSDADCTVTGQVCDEATGTCVSGFDICGPGAGECFVANFTPGCDSSSCCDVVCSFDVSCCLQAWTQNCADMAFQFCSTARVESTPAPESSAE